MRRTLADRFRITNGRLDSELTFDLNLPTSILANFHYPYSFPSPPKTDNQIIRTNESEQHSWYYYLAEIASRHLINRIVESQKRIGSDCTEASIKWMLEELDIFETQLQEWYASLPPWVTFPLPSADIGPLPNELSQFLRGRYLLTRELIYRPFVRVCVSQPLDIPRYILSRVASVGSQGLQYCFYRLCCGIQSRHHGTWFQLRVWATCSLILVAAARSKNQLLLNGASELVFPSNWREKVLHTRNHLSKDYAHASGGTQDYVKLLDWATDFSTVDSSAPSRTHNNL